MTTININCRVRFQLTELGEQIIREHFAALNAKMPTKYQYDWFKFRCAAIVGGAADGVAVHYEEQLWTLMQIFGPHMGIGERPFFKDNELTILEK